MVNPQLLDYIKQQLTAGYDKQDVKQVLLDAGWGEQDINEAFDFYFTSSHPVQQPSTQPSFAPNQPEPTTMRSKTGVLFIILLIILGVIIAGYFVSAKYLNIWPFEVLSPQPILTTTPRPDSYFQIKEWGVEFKLPSDLKDLIYVLDAYGSFPGRSSLASFSTKSLMDLDKQTAGNSKTYCDPKNVPVGGIVWYSTPERGQTNKVIDGHYYYFTTPQATCSDNKQVQVLEGKIVNDLVASFQSLRKISDFNNQISDWQTYRNEKYGFETTLLDSWEALDNNPAGTDLDISFRDKKYTSSFEWPGVRVSTVDIPGEFAGAQQTTSFNLENAKNEVIRIYFSQNGKIIYGSCSLYLDQSVVQKCNQILSTFRFIAPTASQATGPKNCGAVSVDSLGLTPADFPVPNLSAAERSSFSCFLDAASICSPSTLIITGKPGSPGGSSQIVYGDGRYCTIKKVDQNGDFTCKVSMAELDIFGTKINTNPAAGDTLKTRIITLLILIASGEPGYEFAQGQGKPINTLTGKPVDSTCVKN